MIDAPAAAAAPPCDDLPPRDELPPCDDASLRERPLERSRCRPGSREARRVVGRRKDRQAFLEMLARHGDPAVAADQLGLPLFVLFRHRDADPAFAAEWLAAVNYAWERVESRVLAALLSDTEPAGAADRPGRRTGTGMIDAKLALAIVARRDKPVTHKGAPRPHDGAAAARLRAELRALAGLAASSR